jgi:glycosyltransferase involved in cell wall biosynthesis
MKEGKIGIGIITYNRPKQLKKLLDSVGDCDWSKLIVVNDGDEVDVDGWNTYVIKNERNVGVGVSKNIALKHLLDSGCEHIFLIEDDIFIKDKNVFNAYIKASKKSGIQHFNYSQHGIMNKNYHTREANPKITVQYDDVGISLYQHCVGAFSYYSKKCLETVGLLDEDFYNACEHVEHTYRIIKSDMHPPFWNFADIANSWEYLGDEDWSISQSTISSSPKHSEIVNRADTVFIVKHGMLPLQIPQSDYNTVIQSLKRLKSNVEMV